LKAEQWEDLEKQMDGKISGTQQDQISLWKRENLLVTSQLVETIQLPRKAILVN
jgi:hypothetical protein